MTQENHCGHECVCNKYIDHTNTGATANRTCNGETWCFKPCPHDTRAPIEQILDTPTIQIKQCEHWYIGRGDSVLTCHKGGIDAYAQGKAEGIALANAEKIKMLNAVFSSMDAFFGNIPMDAHIIEWAVSKQDSFVTAAMASYLAYRKMRDPKDQQD